MLKQIFRSALMVALLAAICASFSAVQAAPPDLDPTFAGFGDDGVVNLPAIDYVKDLAVQPDGKVVVVGDSGGSLNLTVVRLLPDGSPDGDFGVNGIADFPAMFTARSVALQRDGRIVVGGSLNSVVQLARLMPDGGLDPSFGVGGWVQDPAGGPYTLSAILVHSNGQIVACGSSGTIQNGRDFAVNWYNPDGSPNNSIGYEGTVWIDFGGDDSCSAIAQTPGGTRLVVAGTRRIGDDGDFAVARLDLSGYLDNDFNGNGKIFTNFGRNENGRAITVQPDGKIVMLGARSMGPGAGDTDGLLARYLPNGLLDWDFGDKGKVNLPNGIVSDLAIQPDGKLVAVGKDYPPAEQRDLALGVWRLNPDGTRDLTFDGDGAARHECRGCGDDHPAAVLPDGRILAVGANILTPKLLRLWPDGTLDTGGKQTHAVNAEPIFPPGSDVTFATLAVLPDSGGLVVAGEVAQPDMGRSGAFLTRFHANGLPDTAFGAQGLHLTWFGPGTRTGARAVLVQPDGKIVVAGYSDQGDNQPSYFMVARYRPDGSPDAGFGGGITHDRYLNFAGGKDVGIALALAPDGKIVVAGSVWTGVTYAWGVARLNSHGTPDLTFGTDGKVFNFSGNSANASAVLVQPDGKIIIGGSYNDDFFLQRLLDNGGIDGTFGSNGGYTATDMGGTDNIAALALDADGMIYAGGYSSRGGQDDYALAQYTSAGRLATCPAGQTCNHWPTGKRYVNIGGSDSAFALDLRGDGQLLAAGCTDSHLSAAQVSTTDASAAPLVFQTSFAGHFNCAFSVQFTGTQNNRIIAAGPTYHGTNGNIALARFETTVDTPPTPQPPTPTPGGNPGPAPAGYRVYLPLIAR